MFEHIRSRIHKYRQEKGVATGTLWETGSVTAAAAGSAGSVAAVITTPIDVVKTRIMLSASEEDDHRQQRKGGGGGGDGEMKTGTGETKVENSSKALGNSGRGGEGGGDAQSEKEKAQLAARRGRAGAWSVGKEILRTEGLLALFRGGALRGLWTALGSGLYLGVYESGRKYLENRRVGSDDGPQM